MDSSAQHRITQLGENLYGGVPHYEEHLPRGAQDVNNGLVASAGFRTILNGREANLPGSRRIYRNSSSERYMQHRRGPIWANYKRCFELELNGKVDIAIPQTSSPKLVVVRRAATTNLDHQMQTLLQLMAQPYFARCFEVFGSVSSPYFVCEYLSLTLGHIMGLPLFPTEVEVVAITGQLVEALAFLERHDLVHEGLSMSNILLNDDGYVKIGWARFVMVGKAVGRLTDRDLAEPELCNRDQDGSNGRRNVQELGDLISLLVTKSINKERQLQRQGYSSKLLDFIAASVFSPATQLMQVSLLASLGRQTNWLTNASMNSLEMIGSRII